MPTATETLNDRPYRVLDLDVLRAFVVVVRCASFTEAARQLSRTQSAVSMQIRRLEEQLELVLLQRQRGQIRVTEEGQRLLVIAREMLALNERAFERSSPADVSGRVRIGAIEHFARALLPRVVADFSRRYPAVTVEITTGISSIMKSKLGQEFDLVMGVSGSGASDGQVIARTPVIWATSKQHETHLQRPLPMALQLEGTLFRRWAIGALEGAGIPWRMAYCSSSVAAMEEAVTAGLGVGVFKRDTISKRLRVLAPDDGFPELPHVDTWILVGDTPSQATALMQEHITKSVLARAAMKRQPARKAGRADDISR